MRAVIDPLTGGSDPLAGGNGRGMTDDPDEIAMASGPDAQATETVVGIVKSHALDRAGENFLVCGFLLQLHLCLSRHTLWLIPLFGFRGLTVNFFADNPFRYFGEVGCECHAQFLELRPEDLVDETL